jgi:hypothetical protein
MGTGCPFSGVKRGWGVTLTTHPHLVPWSSVSRSYISSPPSTSMACNGTALLYFYIPEDSSELPTHRRENLISHNHTVIIQLLIFAMQAPGSPPPLFSTKYMPLQVSWFHHSKMFSLLFKSFLQRVFPWRAYFRCNFISPNVRLSRMLWQICSSTWVTIDGHLVRALIWIFRPFISSLCLAQLSPYWPTVQS